jgi:predicted permease
VANLLLARGAARGREVAVRTALGASRFDLIRQLLVESVLLAVGGGLLGLGLAWAGVRILGALAADSLPGGTPGLDPRVLLFALSLSLVTGLVFGLIPALQTSRADLQGALKEGSRGAVGDRSAHAIRHGLVVAEVALALVLLTGAGLLMKSFARLQGVSPGFETGNLLAFTVALPTSRYDTPAQRVAFFEQMLRDVAALPSVRAASAVSILPFGNGGTTSTYNIEGRQLAPDERAPWGDLRFGTPDYFRTMGIPLVKGRVFTEQDGADAPPVAVIDQETVRRWFPDVDPVGKRLTFGAVTDSTRWIEIVGVVGHVKTDGLLGEDRIQLYLPYAQNGASGMQVAVRAAGDPLALVPGIRRVVRSIDADQPIAQVQTMEDMVGASIGQRRLAMTLLALFAGLAMLMASIGIYGVLSQLVTQRNRELGVRIALGAQRNDVLRLVVGQGMTLALWGMALGLAGAFGLTRLIRSQLYGVEPSDPATYLMVAVVLATVALAATLAPALRAARVDPAIAMHQD